MNMVHSIRLREPWERKVLDEEGRGGVKYSRRFHRPTGLDANSKVNLVIESVDGDAAVVLNGRELGQVNPLACPARLEITPLIEANNLVEISLKAEGANQLGLVRLEIEESAFLGGSGGENLTQRREGAEN